MLLSTQAIIQKDVQKADKTNLMLLPSGTDEQSCFGLLETRSWELTVRLILWLGLDLDNKSAREDKPRSVLHLPE